MDSTDLKSLLLYYGRLRFYNSMQKTALDGLAKFPTHSEFRLYNGIALALGTHIQECIRELNPLKNDVELGLAATMTLIYAHKHCRLVDYDAIDVLEHRIVEASNTLCAESYYFASIFLYLIGDFDKALDNINRSMKINADSDASLVLKIWCELSLKAQANQAASGKWQSTLEECIARSNGKNIDASLALIKFYQMRKQYDEALLLINKLNMRFPNMGIPLIEKMETQLAALDWESVLDTANRIINMESFNVPALRIKCLLHIVRESNLEAAKLTLQQLLIAIEHIEPENLVLNIEICQLFSRISSRNEELLNLTLRSVERLNELHPGNIDILNELGCQNLLIGSVSNAEVAFRSTCNIESTNLHALCGLSLCKLKSQEDFGSRQQIKQQLAYIMKLSDFKPNALIMYISALLDDSVQLLIDAAEEHFKKFKYLPFGLEYICAMNPDFILEICDQLVRYTPTPIKDSAYDFDMGQESVHLSLKHCLNFLDVVLNVCQGHQKALFLQAKVVFLCGDHSRAITLLQRVLNLFGDTYTDAHILLAQVLVEKKQYSNALEHLELALAQKFTIRDQPMYHLLKGIILKNQQKFSEAYQSLHFALQLVGSTSTSNQMHDGTTQTLTSTISISDKLTIYIEIIKVLRAIGDHQGIYESERFLESAIEEFNDTDEMGRLIIAHSQLLLEKCNVVEAIHLLSTIKPDQPYYIQAKTQLANIYLQRQRNRNAFSKCFKELVEVRPEPKSYLMLAEAYFSIQEADMAIDAYKKASAMCPANGLLARKIGRCYVKTHQYSKALIYYHEVIKQPGCSALRLDLAELFLQLKQFQNAAYVLSEDNQSNVNDDNLTELKQKTKQLLLLARIHEKSNNIPESLKTLQQARDNQCKVHKLSALGHVENLHEQSKTYSKICILIAQQAVKMKNTELALYHFKECTNYTPNDLEILVSLAHLQMESKEMDMCRSTCQQIIKLDSNNQTASVLMADLSFRKMEFKNAAYHFSQVLLTDPCNWTALAKLIEVMRRSGNLFESLPFLERAEQVSSQSKNATGYTYCKGLFEWYNGNLNDALRFFNMSRRDHMCSQQAKLNMIEICLNPDGDIPSANDLLEAGDSGEFSESRLIALRTAERLLKELGPRPGETYENIITRRIYWNFYQMASKQKVQVELALKDLTELLESDGHQLMVTISYATALALVQLKQIQRAKNHLKRIARLNWNYEEAEYLERSWLLLSDIYIHVNKLDIAETFVDRVLEYNKSSTKAYELAGYIAEKLQSYGDAVKHYQKAWNSCGHLKPHIGYKLALNFMKKKQFPDAVNVCQQVLKLHPDYNIIRKDILEKCRSNLRT